MVKYIRVWLDLLLKQGLKLYFLQNGKLKLPLQLIYTHACKNIYLNRSNTTSAITKGLEDRAYKIPIAHGEGNFFAQEDTIKSIQDNDQILFQYCNEEGAILTEANPNGSLLNIAGIMNKKGNVFGMMPHPERAADMNLANEDGKAMFESILKFA